MLALLVGLLALPSTPSQAARTKPLVVEVLSNRADLVSAGDALVAVRLPRGVRPAAVRVRSGTAT